MEHEDKILQLVGENPRSLKDLSLALGVGKIEMSGVLQNLSSKIKPVKLVSFNGKGRPVVSIQYELI